MIVGEASILVRMDTSAAAAEMKAGLSGDLAAVAAGGEEAGLAAGGGAAKGVEKGLKDTEVAAKESGGKIQGAMVSALSNVGSMFGVQSDAMKSKLESLNLPVIGVAVGIGAIGFAAFKAGASFQEATAQIAAKAGITQAAAGKIGQAFLDTAGQVTFSGTQIAEAYGTVAAQLGEINGKALTSKQAMDVMRASMDLAEASGTGLAGATHSVAATLQAFQEPVSKAGELTDVLFNAANRTGMSVTSLSTRIDMVRSRMGAAAPSLQEMGGLILDLANHGETGRAAVGALTAMVTGLITPSKQATAEQEKLGLTFKDAAGNLLPLDQIISSVKPKIEGMGVANGIAELKALGFGSASKQLYSTVMAGGGALDDATARVEKHGAAQLAAQKATDTWAGSWAKVKAGVGDAMAELGTKMAPVLAEIGKKVAEFIQMIVRDWPQISKVIGEGIKMIEPAVKLLFEWIGKVFTFLIDHKPLLIAALAAIALAFAPWTTAIVGILLLASEIIKHWSTIKDFFVQMWHDIEAALAPVIAYFKVAWDTAVVEFKVAWDIIAAIFKTAWDVIKGIFLTTFDTIKGIVQVFIDLFTGKWGKAWDDIKKTVSKVLGDVLSMITGSLGNIGKLFEQVWGHIRDYLVQVWNIIKHDVLTGLDAVVGFFAKLPGDIATAMGDFVGTAFAAWLKVNEWVIEHIISVVLALFVKLPQQIFTSLGDIVGTAFAALLNAGTWIYNNALVPVIQFFSRLPGQIAGGMVGIVGTIFHELTTAADWIDTNVIQPIITKFTAVPGEIYSAISSGVSSAVNIAKDIVNGVIGLINKVIDFYDSHRPSLFGVSLLPSVPDIQPLAEGGIVTRPTIALIGEAGEEAVIPLPKGGTPGTSSRSHPFGKKVEQHFTFYGVPLDDAHSIMAEASWAIRTASD